jgi:hypothetical protein
MPTRLRKLVGSVAVVVFIAFYVGAAGAAYRFVPSQPLAQLAYFAVVGLVWGVPLLPLIRWMNGGPDDREPPR